LHPRGDFLYFGIIVRLGTVVALGPAADLTFQVSVRLTQVGKTCRGVIYAVQAYEIFDERFTEPPRCFRRKIQTGRQLPAKDDAVNRFHHIERCADNGGVVAIKEYFGSRSIDGVEL